MPRREFLRHASALTLAGIAGACSAAGTGTRRWGVQGGTLIPALEADFEGTLKRMAAMGYTEIGTTGSFGRDPAYVRGAFERAGLTSPSNHVATKESYESFARWASRAPGTASTADVSQDVFSLQNIAATFAENIRVCRVLGQKYAVWSMFTDQVLPSRAVLDAYIDKFNELGELCARESVTFAVHNHTREFTRFGNDVAYDLMIANTDPKKVKFEIDFYWVAKGGGDPIRYLERYPGRFTLCHIKDMTAGGDVAPVGGGVLDIVATLKAADAAGMEHYLVEIDQSPDPLESIRTSIEYLRQHVG